MEITWRAFELRPAGSPPMDPSYKAMIEANWPRVVAMGREYGIEMRSHRFGVNTRPAHRAFKLVQHLAPEQAPAYNMALFRAYFEADKDIGDVSVLASLADELGVDGTALRERLATDEAEAQVLQEETEAHASGITGVPALVFENKYLLSGVRPPEEIEAAVAQIRAMQRETG